MPVHFYYTAESPGLSYFAITAQPVVKPITPAEPESRTPERKDNSIVQMADPEPPKEKASPMIYVLIVLLVLILVSGIVYKLSRKEQSFKRIRVARK